MSFFRKLFSFLVPDPPRPEADRGISVSKAATNQPIPLIFGRRGKVTGSIIHKRTNDNDNDDIRNDLLHVIIVWGEGQIAGIEQIYLDDIPIEDSRFDAENGARVAHARNFTLSMNGYFDPILARTDWTSSDTLEDKATTYCRFEHSPRIGAFNGEPNVKADISGLFILNIRDNVFEPSSNPVDQLYHLLTTPIGGFGLSRSVIDVDSFLEERAYCETLVETVEGSGELRKLFTSNASIDTGQSALDNVNEILLNMRASLPYENGKLRLVLEKIKEPVDFEFTDENIESLGDIVSTRLKDRHNQVVVKYTEPDANWTLQDAIYPPVNSQQDIDGILEDGGQVVAGQVVENDTRRTKNVERPNITDFYEARQYAKTLYDTSRNSLNASVESFDGLASLLEVGDVVLVTHNFPGWIKKPFVIVDYSFTTEGMYTFELVEYQPFIYDIFNEGLKPEIPDTSLTTVPITRPTNIQIEDRYDNQSQVTISWEGTTTNYDIIIEDLDNNVVISERIARKSFNVRGLEIGVYLFQLRALGGPSGRSTYVNVFFNITIPPTPVEVPTDMSRGGVIEVLPPDPPSLDAIYEGLCTTRSDIDPNINDITEFDRVPSGKTLVKSNVVANQTYYVWYRLVTQEGQGEWLSTTVVAQGITREQFEPSFDFGALITDFDTSDIEDAIQTLQIDTIRDSIDRGKRVVAEARQQAFNNRTESAVETLELSVNDPNNGVSATAFRLNEAVTLLDGTASALDLFSLEVEDERTRLNVTVDRLTQVEIDSDNQGSALDVVIADINSPTTGLNALFAQVQEASITADGVANSLTITQNEVANINQGLSATSSLATQAQITANNAANAAFGAQATASSAQGTANSSLALASDIDDDLESIRAVAILTVETDNTLAFVQLGASSTVSQIKIGAGEVVFVNEQDEPAVFFNTNTGNYQFNGTGMFSNGLNSVFNNAFLEIGLDESGGTIPSSTIGYSIPGHLSVVRVNETGVRISGSSSNGAVNDVNINGSTRFSDDVFFADIVTFNGLITGQGGTVSVLDSMFINNDLNVNGTITNLSAGHHALLPKAFNAAVGDLIKLDALMMQSISRNLGYGSLCDSGRPWGVYTNKFSDFDGVYDLHILQSIGEGQINVTNENGDIQKDDLLILSSSPGKAMKQTDDIIRSSTIACTIESHTFTPGIPEKRLSCIYYIG